MASPALLPVPAYTITRAGAKPCISGSFRHACHKRSTTVFMSASEDTRPLANKDCSASRILWALQILMLVFYRASALLAIYFTGHPAERSVNRE
jgi:hypothetical protein